MAPTTPINNNTFVPDHRATAGLIVDFSRNAAEFALNRYIQQRSVEKGKGYYAEMTVEEAGRILNADLKDFIFHDGADRPTRNEGSESFEFKDYETERYDYGFNLGNKAIDQADWDLVDQHSRIKGQQAMTARTQRCVDMLTNVNNWDASHTAEVSAIPGNTGTWAESTVQRADINRSLNHAAQIIHQHTLGAVKPKDLILVVSPACAAAISVSQELKEYLRGSPDASREFTGEWPSNNAMFGLPDRLFGYDVVVEDAVRVTSKKGATKATNYILDGEDAVMVARPGGLISPTSGPNFSTCMLFLLEDMTVETINDDRNRRVEGHVVDDFSEVMTAPVSGYYFQKCLTP